MNLVGKKVTLVYINQDFVHMEIQSEINNEGAILANAAILPPGLWTLEGVYLQQQDKTKKRLLHLSK